MKQCPDMKIASLCERLDMCIESEVRIEGDAQSFNVCETGTREPAAFMCIMGGRVLGRCTVPRSMHSDLNPSIENLFNLSFEL